MVSWHFAGGKGIGEEVHLVCFLARWTGFDKQRLKRIAFVSVEMNRILNNVSRNDK